MDYAEFNKLEFKRWMFDRGDSTLRLNYILNKDSLVIDAGGFKGEWANSIHQKYGSKILIFEPINSYT